MGLHGDAMTAHDGRSCVVLKPPEVNDAIAPLRSSPPGARWRPIETTDPLMAMAELCLLDRTGAVGSRWDDRAAPRGRHLALVVVQPARWGQLQDLLAATRRYLPGTTIWALQDGRLAVLHGGGPGCDGPSDEPDERRAEHDDDDVTPCEITREELEMLFGHQPPDAEP